MDNISKNGKILLFIFILSLQNISFSQKLNYSNTSEKIINSYDQTTNYPSWSNWVAGYADKFTVMLKIPTQIVSDGKMRFHLVIYFKEPVNNITSFKIKIFEKDFLLNHELFNYEKNYYSLTTLSGEIFNDSLFTEIGPTREDASEDIFAEVTFYQNYIYYDEKATPTISTFIFEDDGNEEDDDFDNAYDLGKINSGVSLFRILADNNDYFKFNVGALVKRFHIRLNDFFHKAGDFGIRLYNSSRSSIKSVNEPTDLEEIILDLDEGTYYVRVLSYDGGKGFYTLHLNIPIIPNLKIPKDYANITNQPITFDWYDVPYISKYQFDISDNINFTGGTSVLVNYSEITPSGKILPGTYFWKVKSIYVWGESDWSDTWRFTVPEEPYINVTSPTFNSVWQAGTIHNITWQDNISENVKIELIKGATSFGSISNSEPSNGNYEWIIDNWLTSGNDYKIIITSTADGSVSAESEPFTISSAPKLTVTPENKAVNSASGSTSFFVDANLTWTATESEPWITKINPNTGNSANAFMVYYEQNTSTVQRIGKITVSGGGINIPVTITQAPSIPIRLDVSESKIVSAVSTSTTFDISSNVSWTVTENEPWITSIEPSSGSNNGAITVRYLANSTNEQRTGTVIINGGGITISRTITQSAQSVYITKIRIIGPEEVNESTNTTYSCAADYSNNTTYPIPSSEIKWSLNSTLYASISSAGVLTTKSVSSDQSVTITAQWNGKTDTHSITIKNLISIPKPPINPYPPHWGIDVPINAQLTWENGGGADYYTVMFEGVIQGEQTSTSFDPGILEYDKLYTWAILAHNSIGKSSTTFWKFTTIKASQTKIQTIPLNTGWNLISLNVHPDDLSTINIFQPVISSLKQVKDISYSYNPSLPSYLNTLTELEDGFAYWVNVSESVNLNVEGIPIDNLITKIPIQNGWNLIGYVCQYQNSIESALSSILSIVLQVKDLSSSYDPTVPAFLNTLTTLTPSKGYWIKSSSQSNLIYPTPSNLSKVIGKQNISNEEIWDVTYYPNSMVFYGKINDEYCPLGIEDIIGVFNENECRGFGHLVEYKNGKYATIVINGEKEEELFVKGFDIKNKKEYAFSNKIEFVPGKILTQPALITLINAEKENELILPTATKLLPAFPNPCNPNTNISFYIHENSDVSIYVYSINGELVKKLDQGFYSPGQYSVIWNGDNNSGEACNSGIYFITLNTNSVHLTQKIILMK